VKPRIFLIEPCRFDIRDALKYGEFKQLFDGSTFRNAVFDPSHGFDEDIVNALKEQGYRPKTDKVILAGSVAIIARSTAAIVAEWGSFDAVIYDKMAESFVLLTIGNKVTR
jgi:hypothetical protein